MYILSDGKNYVMENELKIGEYMPTTYAVKAKKFTYKQAKSFLSRPGKRYSWVRSYQMIDDGSGEKPDRPFTYKGNAGAYIGKNDVEFDESILDKIYEESHNILGLAGWDSGQLNTYMNLLSAALGKYDSAESDIVHALQTYKDRYKKKPQAHKMAKIGYILEEVRDKHKRIKECIRYVQVMQDGIKYQYSIGKLKEELSKASNSEYKGRTEYYKTVLDILGG